MEIDAGRLRVDAIDVFCEKGVFELEHSRRILLAGRDVGLRMNFHGDELNPLGGGQVISTHIFSAFISFDSFFFFLSSRMRCNYYLRHFS
jgi:hypothetical protein